MILMGPFQLGTLYSFLYTQDVTFGGRFSNWEIHTKQWSGLEELLCNKIFCAPVLCCSAWAPAALLISRWHPQDGASRLW